MKPTEKRIDFDTLSGTCVAKNWDNGECFNLRYHMKVKALCCPEFCPIWASLPEVPEDDPDTDREGE